VGSVPFLDNSQAHANVGSQVTEKGLEWCWVNWVRFFAAY